MSLFKKIIKDNETKHAIKTSTENIKAYNMSICVSMSRLLKLINSVATNISSMDITLFKQFQNNRTLEFLQELNNFAYNFSNYQQEVSYLLNLTKNTPNKKLKIKNPAEVIDSINTSFIEIYSRFLVKVQFDENNRNTIKQKFIDVINKFEIPVHTNEQLV